ncbi:hypothetical protein N7492_003131 [Penicillium capsulatum]|uniref:Uncharacterized protein n=1 Tax=Penicillium capsulatum TaxID=69766 RepID=A0A9W9LVU1_9EURO|nr:hypothetical protein N7492_003131 [Penicillium capsulatum]KAJ6122279.1 hypothetical protein N7512_004744 [Penicillium capsulatum]
MARDRGAHRYPRVWPATKRKPRRDKVRASNAKQAKPTDANPPPASPPLNRRRIQNDSEISALDLGPSFSEHSSQPFHIQNRVTDASQYAKSRMVNPYDLESALLAVLASEDGKARQPSRTRYPEHRAETSNGMPGTDVLSKKSCQQSCQSDNACAFASTTYAPDPTPLEQPLVSTNGNVPDHDYSYGFINGTTRVSSTGIIPSASTSTPSLPQSFPFQGLPISPQDFPPTVDREILHTQNEDLIRYEQSLELFPGVQVEDHTPDEGDG